MRTLLNYDWGQHESELRRLEEKSEKEYRRTLERLNKLNL